MEKKQKLRSNRDFRKVYDNGKSLSNRFFVIFFTKNNLGYNRVGFSTTKKIGKNVARNKVKRRMKEIYRLNSSRMKDGYDIIFLSRVASKDADYKQLKKSMINLVKSAGLLKKEE